MNLFWFVFVAIAAARSPGPSDIAPNVEFGAAAWVYDDFENGQLVRLRAVVNIYSPWDRTVQKTIHIGESPADGANRKVFRSLRISPDSARIAALWGGQLYVVDVQRGSVSIESLEGQGIAEVAWKGPGTVRYRVLQRADTSTKGSFPHVRIFEHYVGQPPEQRREVLGDTGPVIRYAPNTWISHSGRYLVFVEAEGERKLRIVDVDRSVVHDGGASTAESWQAAWSPDESGLLCVTFSDSSGKPDRAVFVELPAGRAIDVSEPFRRLVLANVRRDSVSGIENYVFSVTGDWTADGKYVVAHGSSGGFLFRPIPWEVIPLGPEMKERILAGGLLESPEAEFYAPYQGGYRPVDWQPLLITFPVAAWVRMRFGNTEWLVNYDMGELVPIGRTHVVRTERGLLCFSDDQCAKLPREVKDLVIVPPLARK